MQGSCLLPSALPKLQRCRQETAQEDRTTYPLDRGLAHRLKKWSESLIKQINARVKGTEMFWDDPQGAEAILHIRAAALSEDGRLDDYLATRPGYPFVRRSTFINLSA